MRLLTTMLTLALAMPFGAVQAQTYRWVDKDGKVRYSDVPPTGGKATSLKPPPSAPAPAPAAKADAGKDDPAKGDPKKDAKAGPLTPAEQERAYRERQLKAKEEKEKEDQKIAEAERKKQNCTASQEALRGLERGGRVATVNAQGETQYLDDAQRAARVEQARAAVAESCR